MTKTEIQLNSRTLDNGMRFWLIAGWIVLFLIFGVGGAWSFFARISGAVIAPGQISPESGVRTVQHPDGGVVKAILVREGETVKKGQILLVLEDENLRAQLEITENRLDHVRANIARLTAEQSHAQKIVFPDILIAKAQTDPRVAQLLQTQRAFFQSRKQTIEAQQKVIKQSISAERKIIAGLKARLHAVEKQSALIAEEINTVSKLLKKGQAIRPRLLALQREAARLEGEKGTILEEIARRQDEIIKLIEQHEQLDKDFITNVMADLAKYSEEYENLKAQLLALKTKLSRIEIRAPISGRIFNMSIRTLGGVIKPGQQILQIVPNDEPLIIEAHVKLNDIDEVYPQQKARIYFSTLASRNAPELLGQVTMVAPAPITGQQWQPPYYKVEIEVPSKQLSQIKQKYRLIPGMPVEVFLTTKARRPFDILYKDLIFPKARRALRSD